MAIRRLIYEVSPSGVSAKNGNFAGFVGDHKATEIEFVLRDGLAGVPWACRVEYTDRYGGHCDTTDTMVLAEGDSVIRALIPSAWTQTDGTMVLGLVLELDGMIVHTFAAHPVLYSRTAYQSDTSAAESALSNLILDTQEAASEARKAADDARQEITDIDGQRPEEGA